MVKSQVQLSPGFAEGRQQPESGSPVLSCKKQQSSSSCKTPCKKSVQLFTRFCREGRHQHDSHSPCFVKSMSSSSDCSISVVCITLFSLADKIQGNMHLATTRDILYLVHSKHPKTGNNIYKANFTLFFSFQHIKQKHKNAL